jgi:hypothetical protein
MGKRGDTKIEKQRKNCGLARTIVTVQDIQSDLEQQHLWSNTWL